jgi:hypothetical protein
MSLPCIFETLTTDSLTRIRVVYSPTYEEYQVRVYEKLAGGWLPITRLNYYTSDHDDAITTAGVMKGDIEKANRQTA